MGFTGSIIYCKEGRTVCQMIEFRIGIFFEIFPCCMKGISGMCIMDLHQTLVRLLLINRPPRYLLVHCGGNDIGAPVIPLRQLNVYETYHSRNF
jgi:hypothetical protein